MGGGGGGKWSEGGGGEGRGGGNICELLFLSSCSSLFICVTVVIKSSLANTCSIYSFDYITNLKLT